MYLVAIEFLTCREFAYLAIDAGVDVSLLGQRLKEFAIVTLAALHNRGQQCCLAPIESVDYKVADLLVRVVNHLLARGRGVGTRGARIEQTQKVVDLGDGAHGRAGVLVGSLLLDSHHGAQACDFIDIGALHRAYELSRVGREGLHVAALSLGVYRVEGQ